uniref:COMM domain-containing protein 4 n=1 Tax=Tabanus bromius TaxID=304241 RepID=A0A0K8TQ82_TABBR
MKFRFCGDGDCPDWILGEIHSSLSVLSSVKLRIVSQAIAKSILGDELPEEKIKDVFASSKTENASAKSAVACIRFLLVSAARHNADETTFGEELQQLGLPKEHANALCRVLAEYVKEIRKKLLETSLTVDEMDDIIYTIPKDTIECAQLEVKIKNEIVDGVSQNTTHKINIHKVDLLVLLDELKTIKQIMESYDYEKKYSEVDN